MNLLSLLSFWPSPWRHYALLDAQGICRALRHARMAPQGAGWVEVNESRLSWLHQPLPASAHRRPQIAQSPRRLPRAA
ncbi:hypothetical protein NVV93_15435 [Pseudomonas sp. LS44]|uniref:hypothetical protein n=1 Tax=Pseudomonas sp. LS44 TaxID=1357074 RepID=UPI00215AE36A|nr:hypothetical protein [Pseudomonas sp. LS44]UVE16972.1 hypothetical protein NVV93_15435 [Pseudomonas sp. LS44]